MYNDEEDDGPMQATSTCKCVGFRYCGLCEKSERVVQLLADSHLQSADAVLEKVRQGVPQSSCSFLTLPSQPDTLVICPSCQQWFQPIVASADDPVSCANDSTSNNSSSIIRTPIVRDCKDHTAATHRGPLPPRFRHLAIQPDAISPEVESDLIAYLDRDDGNGWKASQSGRKKQEWGPQANFKKRRVKLREGMEGMPKAFEPLFNVVWELTEKVDRDEDHMNLTYSVRDGDEGETLDGAAVEPPRAFPVNHGPMIIVESSALEYLEGCSNLDPHMDDPWLWGPRIAGVSLEHGCVMTFVSPSREQVEVFLPARWAFVLYKEVRYEWLHGIRSGHLVGRRLSITMRELNPEVQDVDEGILSEARRHARTFV